MNRKTKDHSHCHKRNCLDEFYHLNCAITFNHRIQTHRTQRHTFRIDNFKTDHWLNIILSSSQILSLQFYFYHPFLPSMSWSCVWFDRMIIIQIPVDLSYSDNTVHTRARSDFTVLFQNQNNFRCEISKSVWKSTSFESKLRVTFLVHEQASEFILPSEQFQLIENQQSTEFIRRQFKTDFYLGKSFMSTIDIFVRFISNL